MMRRTFKVGLALMVVLGSVMVARLTIAPARAEAEPAKKIWAKSYLGQKAPELVVEKWLTQTPDTQGKFVLIDFWATWCPPCRETIPELNAWQEKFGDKLVVIGVSDESEEKVRALKNPQPAYFLAIDPQERTKNKFEVTGIPHVVVIDPEGIVRWEGFPLLEGHELTTEVLTKILEKSA